jgi:hypothetical protein
LPNQTRYTIDKQNFTAMSKISKIETFGKITLAMVIGLFATEAKSSNTPYLKLVGPPPLRFEVITPNSPLFIAELALPKPNNDNAVEETATNNLAADGNETKPAVGSTEANMDGILGGPAKNAVNPANAASDMLNITPQMITEYLKPDRSEAPEAGQFQPGQSILVPAELGFVPPMPGGSRAIYISK